MGSRLITLALGTSDGSNIPILDTDLLPEITFTRASAAYCFVGTTYTSFATNVPRYGSLTIDGLNPGFVFEGARTNSIRNSTMVGAVVGAPGTSPTNWMFFHGGATTGLTRTIVATGTINGMSYVDIQLSGTPSGASTYTFAFESATQIAALTAQTWSASAYIAIIAGSLTNITSLRHRVTERTSGGVTVVDNLGTDFDTSLTSSLQRFTYAPTLNGGGTTAAIQPGIMFDYAALPINITIRIAAPQIELGAFTSSFIPTSTVAVTRAAESARIADLNTRPWFNASEGTLLAEFKRDLCNTFSVAATIDDGTSSNTFEVYQGSAANSLVASYINVSGGVTTALTDISTGNANINCKIAATYKVNDFAISLNGAAVVADTNGAILVSPTGLSIGRQRVSASQLYGVIKRLIYYPRRLPNATLVGLSA